MGIASTMIFEDWKAAKAHISQKFEDNGLTELADYVWQFSTEESFRKFCTDMENVARVMNEIDWHKEPSK